MPTDMLRFARMMAAEHTQFANRAIRCCGSAGRIVVATDALQISANFRSTLVAKLAILFKGLLEDFFHL